MLIRSEPPWRAHNKQLQPIRSLCSSIPYPQLQIVGDNGIRHRGLFNNPAVRNQRNYLSTRLGTCTKS